METALIGARIDETFVPTGVISSRIAGNCEEQNGTGITGKRVRYAATSAMTGAIFAPTTAICAMIAATFAMTGATFAATAEGNN